jgi:REP element-mobilizing transposase RayT
MPMASRQLDLALPRRGGKRKGAGRPPKGLRAGVPHTRRPHLSKRTPVHVTLRTVPEVGRLRTRDMYKVIRQASITSVGYSRSSGRCRICHLSIQGNHIHLIAEADDRVALSRGMQGFQISCAKRVNALLSRRLGIKRRGSVFADRYHSRMLRTPREVRSALSYCLNNWRRHGERAFAAGALDPFATGMFFDGWSDHGPTTSFPSPPDLLMVWAPKAWLLTTGWKRHRLVSTREVPGPS